MTQTSPTGTDEDEIDMRGYNPLEDWDEIHFSQEWIMGELCVEAIFEHIPTKYKLVVKPDEDEPVIEEDSPMYGISPSRPNHRAIIVYPAYDEIPCPPVDILTHMNHIEDLISSVVPETRPQGNLVKNRTCGTPKQHSLSGMAKLRPDTIVQQPEGQFDWTEFPQDDIESMETLNIRPYNYHEFLGWASDLTHIGQIHSEVPPHEKQDLGQFSEYLQLPYPVEIYTASFFDSLKIKTSVGLNYEQTQELERYLDLNCSSRCSFDSTDSRKTLATAYYSFENSTPQLESISITDAGRDAQISTRRYSVKSHISTVSKSLASIL